MDEYQPPPAFGFSPNEPSDSYSYSHRASATQNNDPSFNMNSVAPSYGIPGLQTTPNTSQRSTFPLQQLWQHLQDNSFISHTPNSFPLNTIQSVSTPANLLNLNASDAATQYIGENTQGQEGPAGPLEDGKGVTLAGADSGVYEMDRSESGEISDGEIMSDESDAEEGELAADFRIGNSSSLAPPFSIPEPPLSISHHLSEAHRRQSSAFTVQKMDGDPKKTAPSIPGLGEPTPNPEQDYSKCDQLIIAAFRNMSAVGISFARMYAGTIWTDDERRVMWELWNAAGLPISSEEAALYSTSVTQMGPELLSNQISESLISASTKLGDEQKLHQHKPTSSAPENAISVHEPPTQLTQSSTALEHTKSDRNAYLAKLQAARSNKLTASSKQPTQDKSEEVVAASSSTIGGSSSSDTPARVTDQTKNEIIKQKLDALRKMGANGSNQSNRLQTQQQSTLQAQSPSTNTLSTTSHSYVDIQRSPATQFQSVGILDRAPSATIQPETSDNSPETPTTPIPGLFMSGVPSKSGQPYFSPPAQVSLEPDGSLGGRGLDSNRCQLAASGSKGQRGVHGFSPTVWGGVQQEKVVINLDSDDETEDELDLESKLSTAEKANVVKSPPLEQVQPLIKRVTEPAESMTHDSSQEQDISQPEKPVVMTALEKKLAEAKAKLRAQRLQSSAASRLAATNMPGISSSQGLIPPAPISVVEPRPMDPTATVQLSNVNNVPYPSDPADQTGLVAQSALSQSRKRRSEDPDASGEWKKKRRAEIQSDLQNRDLDLGSTAAKIAEMERQLALLHEDRTRKQQAREQLAKELEELGVDTEGMSHEEMQATKDDIEAAQKVDSHQSEDQSVRENHGECVDAAAETAVHAIPPMGQAQAESMPEPSDTIGEMTIIAKPQTVETSDMEADGSFSGGDSMSMGSTDEDETDDIGGVAIEANTNDEELRQSADESQPQINVSAMLPASEVNYAVDSKAQDKQLELQPWNYQNFDEALSEPCQQKISTVNRTEPSEQEQTPLPPAHDAESVTKDVTTNESPAVASDSLANYHSGPEPTGGIAKLPQYRPYESPFSMFKSYRFHPEYPKTVASGFRSLTYSHNIDPKDPFCQTELAEGECNDPTCGFQHFGKVGLTGDKVLVQLGTDNPGKTEEQQNLWNHGLKELIKDLRGQNVKDPEVVAAHIAEYRREFLEEQGEQFSVLNLGPE